MHSLQIVGRKAKTGMEFSHFKRESATDMQLHDSTILLKCFHSIHLLWCRCYHSKTKTTKGQQNIRI